MNTDPIRRRAIIALIAVNLLWGISFPAMKAINQVMESPIAGEHDQVEPAHSDVYADLTLAKNDRRTAAMDRHPSLAEMNRHLLAASFLTGVRFAISFGLLYLTMPRLFRGMTPAHWRMGIWTGLAFSPGLIMQNVGLNYVPASRSGFLTSLTVVTTPLVMIVLERRMPRWLVLCGAAVGLFGTAILTELIIIDGPLSMHLANDALSRLGPGDWLTITAALIFTAQILLIDRFSRRMPAGQLTPGMFVAALMVGVLVFAVAHTMDRNAPSPHVWGAILADTRFLTLALVLSVFCTILAFHWMNKYQGHITPAQAALIYTTEPIFATIWAMILPNMISRLYGINYWSERPGPELLIGGIIIVVGNGLALWPARPVSGDR